MPESARMRREQQTLVEGVNKGAARECKDEKRAANTGRRSEQRCCQRVQG